MAEWEHKEEIWKAQHTSGDHLYRTITQWVRENDRAVYTSKSFSRTPLTHSTPELVREHLEEENRKSLIEEEAWKNECITFVEFLDLHCKGGWEVFKISRDFNNNSGTWCIFRRLV